MQTVKQHNSLYSRYLVRREILYAKDKNAPYSRPLLPTELEDQVIRYVHTSLGHLETEKCMFHISHTFHLTNLSSKVRKLISRYSVCRMVKHPTRRFETECRNHIPRAVGDICTVGIYGPLASMREGIHYIFVCLDVFTNNFKLHALRAAATKPCLQKTTPHYIVNVTPPTCVLNDNVT
jgi:hypothetical protein